MMNWVFEYFGLINARSVAGNLSSMREKLRKKCLLATLHITPKFFICVTSVIRPCRHTATIGAVKLTRN